jgi:hypothetical protein
MTETPISEHCAALLERIRQDIAELNRPFTLTDGHDPGDEDPNAWS